MESTIATCALPRQSQAALVDPEPVTVGMREDVLREVR